ncbi:MAG: hypothetical protein JKY23_04450, partial [Nitrospinaceae bacterium]|nr:hypothetical protein [Nitrospinaceae bacterium]
MPPSNPQVDYPRLLSVGPGHGPVPSNSAGVYPSSNPWAAFFGNPKGPIYQAQGYEKENADLPDAYMGQNYFMSQVMIREILAGDSYLVTEVLPWQKSEDKDELRWDVITFNDNLLGRRAEESVSRMLSYQRHEESAGFVSYGVAMILESGFYNTAQGKMHYAMNLRQISNATVSTACLGAAQAILNPKAPYDGLNHKMDSALPDTEFFKLLEQERDDWGMAHDTTYGVNLSLDMMKRKLAARGVTPNYVIAPAGMAKFLEFGRPEFQGKSGNPIGSLNGIERVRESKSVPIGEGRDPIDPFFQTRTIGSYYKLSAAACRDVPAQFYTTSMRSIYAWSEDANGWKKHTLAKTIKASGIVDSEWGLRGLGERFFASYPTWGKFLKDTDFLAPVVKGIMEKKSLGALRRIMELDGDGLATVQVQG